jgi:hypothetical protein
LAGAAILLGCGIAIGFLLGVARTNAVPKRDSDGRLLGNYLNNHLATKITTGTSLSKVIAQLGDPIGQSDGWLEFVSSSDGRRPRVKLGPTALVSQVDPGIDGQK